MEANSAGAEVTPADRAEAAARDLADRGLAVTARAVREAAGVRMDVAAAAARAWKEVAEEDRAVPVPDVPEDVAARVGAIWADAYRAALAIVSPERDRLAREVKELSEEVDGLTAIVADVESERDRVSDQRVVVEKELGQVQSELGVAHADLQQAAIDIQEARMNVGSLTQRCADLTEERDRLVGQVGTLMSKIPAPAVKRGTAGKSTDSKKS